MLFLVGVLIFSKGISAVLSFKSNLGDVAKDINLQAVEARKGIQEAVNKSTRYGLSEIKQEVAIKTGQLAKSYKSVKLVPFVNLIYSDSAHAEAYEKGVKPRVIKPRAGHTFLMFANNDGAVHKNSGQIKKAAVDNLFKHVGYNKKSGKLYSKVEDVPSVLSIFNWVGVSLARQVNNPGYKGKFNLGRNNGVVERISDMLQREILLTLKRS
jgi:hypothetical protein